MYVIDMSLSLATSFDNVSTCGKILTSISSVSISSKGQHKVVTNNNCPMVAHSKMGIYKTKTFTSTHIEFSIIEPSSIKNLYLSFQNGDL